MPFLFLNAALYMLVRYVNVLLRLENDVRAYTVQTLWMNACLNLIYLLPGFFHLQRVGVHRGGAGGLRRGWPSPSGSARWAPPGTKFPPRPGGLRALKADRGVYRLMLPYGLLLAPAAILTPLYRSVCLSFLAAGPGATSQGLFEFAYTLAQLVTDGAGGVFHLLGAVCLRPLPHRAGAHRPHP